MSTSTAATPRRSRKTTKTARPKTDSAARKSRQAARRRELERIVGPMVRRLGAQEIEHRIDVAAAQAALDEGGEPIPWEVVKARLGW